MKPSLDQSKNKLIAEISTFFDKNYIEQLACDTGFVQRESKLQGLDFFLLCVFAQQKTPYVSLNGMCEDLFRQGIYLSKQSLHDRFNSRSVEFMHQIVGQALSQKINDSGSLVDSIFNRIIIGDSTSFLLPKTLWEKPGLEECKRTNKAVQMIQYRYNLLTHEIIAIDTQSGFNSDANSSLYHLYPNDLIIEDLGYFKLNRFRNIAQSGAFFLSRLRFDIAIYQDKGDCYKQADLLKIQRSMRNNEIRSFDIYLGEELMPARLIIEKVPKKVADERRRRLKENKQYKRKGITQRRLDLCNINAYITNTTEDQLPCTKVRQCYSLRWQIEIIFKTWKSIYHLNKVSRMSKERFECFHYGCLMLIILSTRITSHLRSYLFKTSQQELSELKVNKLIMSQMIKLYYSGTRIASQIKKTLNLLLLIIKRTCIKEHKKDKQNPIEILKYLSLT